MKIKNITKSSSSSRLYEKLYKVLADMTNGVDKEQAIRNMSSDRFEINQLRILVDNALQNRKTVTNEELPRAFQSASVDRKSCDSKKDKGVSYTWMPKDSKHSGHMDTQMYPECEGTKYDRNISKKHRNKKKKHSFNLSKSVRISCAKPSN